MSTMYGDGIHLTPNGVDGQGRVIYVLGLTDQGKNFTFPGPRQMKRLARKFLGGELNEVKERRTPMWVYFTIPVGTSAENRAAFLGAVRHHCKQL